MCGIMGDPELRSDESVLLRTQGIFVKSIPFEGILTNKRIILVDRATNLLPQKEIPLVTLKDFQAGENAIRDQIIILSVMAKTGETRQMILTFSRQTGGTRIKERDDWMRVLKENTSSSFEQVIRKVMPGIGQSSKKLPRCTSTDRDCQFSRFAKSAACQENCCEERSRGYRTGQKNYYDKYWFFFPPVSGKRI